MYEPYKVSLQLHTYVYCMYSHPSVHKWFTILPVGRRVECIVAETGGSSNFAGCQSQGIPSWYSITSKQPFNAWCAHTHCIPYYLAYIHVYVSTLHSGACLLGTLLDLDFCPYYRGLLKPEVHLHMLQHNTGTKNSVLMIEITSILRFVGVRSIFTV